MNDLEMRKEITATLCKLYTPNSEWDENLCCDFAVIALDEVDADVLIEELDNFAEKLNELFTSKSHVSDEEIANVVNELKILG